jgi:hypothetical protein
MNEKTEYYANMMYDFLELETQENKKESFLLICNKIYSYGYFKGIQDERITKEENKEFPL